MIRSLALAILLSASAPAWSQGGPTWNGLSGAGSDSWPAGGAVRVAAISDRDSNAIVAWSDDSSGTSQVRISRWNGSAWVDLAGAALATQGASTAPVLGYYYDNSVFPAREELSVAWLETDAGGPRHIHVRQLNMTAGSWASIGSAAGAYVSASAGAPAMERDGNRMVIAWTEMLATPQVYALVCPDLRTPSWMDYLNSASGGGLSNSTKGASQPTIGFETWLSYFRVAWVDRDESNGGIRLRAWSSYGGWSAEPEVASIGADGVIDDESAPAYVSEDSRMWLLWSAKVGATRQIYVKRFDAKGKDKPTDPDPPPPPDYTHGSGISDTDGRAIEPALALLPGRVPVASWIEIDAAGHRNVYVRAMNSATGAWEGIDGSASGSGLSGTGAVLSRPAIVIGQSSTPIVIWPEGGPGRIVVRQKDPAWAELASSGKKGIGVSNSPLVGSTTPAVIVDATGHPIVAWSETANSYTEVYVRRWDDSGWAALGGGNVSNTSTGHSTAPALAIDGLGRVVIAWEEGPSNREIYVKRLSAGSWQPLGGPSGIVNISNTPVWSKTPALALDAAGNPVVAWSERVTVNGDTRMFIYAKRWSGSAWQGFGSSDTGSGLSGQDAAIPVDAQMPSIAIAPSGAIAVSWTASYPGTVRRDIRTRVYNPVADSWGPLGADDRVNPEAGTSYVSPFRSTIAFDGTGAPVVAWDQGGGVNLLRWDGQAWRVYGEALTPRIGGGARPVLAIDIWGRPVVASCGSAVSVLRWDGASWVGNGGSEGGVSYAVTPAPFGASDFSAPQALALNAYGDPVAAWTDLGEVYFRRFTPATASFERNRQFREDGVTPIPPGGKVVIIDGSAAATVVVEAVMVDPDGTASVEAELTGTGSGDGALTSSVVAGGGSSSIVAGPTALLASGSKVTFTVTLPLAGSYQRDFSWRVRGTDHRGIVGPWSEFAGSTAADIIVRDDYAPIAGTAMVSVGGAPVGDGSTVDDRMRVSFSAGSADDDGDRVQLQVRLTPVGSGFDQVLTGDLAASGGDAQLTARIQKGSYRWDYRLVDEYGMAGAWTAHAASGTEPDLFVGSAGSFGVASACAHSAAGLGGAAMMLVLVVLGGLRR